MNLFNFRSIYCFFHGHKLIISHKEKHTTLEGNQHSMVFYCEHCKKTGMFWWHENKNGDLVYQR